MSRVAGCWNVQVSQFRSRYGGREPTVRAATATRMPLSAPHAPGWPTPPELNSQIERVMPHAAGYWHAVDKLIGLLKTMPLAEQARTGLPWVHQVIASRSRVPGMGTWLTVEWLRSLHEGRAVDDSVRPLYDAVLDALAKEDCRGAVDLQRQGE